MIDSRPDFVSSTMSISSRGVHPVSRITLKVSQGRREDGFVDGLEHPLAGRVRPRNVALVLRERGAEISQVAAGQFGHLFSAVGDEPELARRLDVVHLELLAVAMTANDRFARVGVEAIDGIDLKALERARTETETRAGIAVRKHADLSFTAPCPARQPFGQIATRNFIVIS